MAEDGLKTLRHLLAKPIDSEATVVYFLVEVRKRIDSMGEGFDVLKFFCDWILHPRLEWQNAREIVKAFDDVLGQELKQANTLPKLLTNQEYLSNLRPLTSMKYLLNDLFVFLGLHRLDTSLVGNLDRWGPFLSLYVDIVSRTPLCPKSTALQYLDTIRVKKSHIAIRPAPVDDDTFMFTIEWSFLKDGHERMSITNEVWFPAKPIDAPVTIARFENRNGTVHLVPQSSQAFWKRPK